METMLIINCIGNDFYKDSRFYDVVYQNGYYITRDSYNRKFLADNIDEIYEYIIEDLKLENILVIHLKEIGDKNSIDNEGSLIEFKKYIYECLSNKLTMLKQIILMKK